MPTEKLGYVPILLLFFAAAAGAGELQDRVEAALKQRGLEPDALGLVDNFIRHEVRAPPRVPELIPELFARPVDAADAAAVFRRSVPPVLERIGLEQGDEGSFEAALERYLAAVNGSNFLEATARFVRDLRSPGLEFPAPRRFASRIGLVVIGGPGPDRHGADAALIVDPGGDDVYERAPPAAGAFSVVIDLTGNDQYGGSDIAEGAYSALIDLAGDDRYVMQGGGLGAAISGTSLLLDLQGDDYYEAGTFGQGAAAARGLGVLIDRQGNDRYVLQARGQGYGTDGGVGLLWDGAGDDSYVASGAPDFYRREGGVSFAQGAARGERSTLAGGTGILRDDAGNDRYEAQMFAQGIGYYFALGLLWDRGGNDRYRAVRYAHGAGVHQAIGVLRDEAGDDDYILSAGVGQGVGQDMAIGLLVDAAGDDRYAAQYTAQGSALFNGLGLLADLGGRGRWQLGADWRAWGEAEGARGVPSFGLLVHDPARAEFVRPVLPPRVAASDDDEDACPGLAPAARAGTEPLVPLLVAIGRDISNGQPQAATYGDLLRRLLDAPFATLREVPVGQFTAMWTLARVLPCAAAAAPDEAAVRLWAAFEALLATDRDTLLAGMMVGALRKRPAPPEQQQRFLAAFDAHSSCAVRSLALGSWPTLPRARRALASPCWREQAAALDALRRLGAPAPQNLSTLPSFLRRLNAP